MLPTVLCKIRNNINFAIAKLELYCLAIIFKSTMEDKVNVNDTMSCIYKQFTSFPIGRPTKRETHDRGILQVQSKKVMLILYSLVLYN